ncbi:hypothetical protein K402DRAFT_457141 [Aulographum hederae CBS 113979]|uniref:Uncharacterized protein n=1 Tax=Aulographum hederae CBS 113979 TaxID=1176131 RepID=A0A6G1GP71_9PEZI|nr:hypothetical protein K402DRAFT_457141 [Aulographum hederae CBS 113979]
MFKLEWRWSFLKGTNPPFPPPYPGPPPPQLLSPPNRTARIQPSISPVPNPPPPSLRPSNPAPQPQPQPLSTAPPSVKSDPSHPTPLPPPQPLRPLGAQSTSPEPLARGSGLSVARICASCVLPFCVLRLPSAGFIADAGVIGWVVVKSGGWSGGTPGWMCRYIRIMDFGES